MKKITIPQSIELEDIKDANGNKVVIEFKDFVGKTLLADPKFGKAMADILSAVEIKSKLSAGDGVLELDNEDYEKLLSVAAEPSNAYNPVIVMQLVPFLLAIKNAQ